MTFITISVKENHDAINRDRLTRICVLRQIKFQLNANYCRGTMKGQGNTGFKIVYHM
jgi:hypothetical protein